ncbi:hypothetical protein P7K49_013292, partial [Saguinus oedipus]
ALPLYSLQKPWLAHSRQGPTPLPQEGLTGEMMSHSPSVAGTEPATLRTLGNHSK